LGERIKPDSSEAGAVHTKSGGQETEVVKKKNSRVGRGAEEEKNLQKTVTGEG